MDKFISLFKVAMNPEVNKNLLETIHSGWIGEGPKVKQFEEELRKRIGNDNVVALSSGTHGLSLALAMEGIGPGDEVISTPLTCFATNAPILATGAKIVWADIDPYTLNIDAYAVKEKIRLGKTKAIIAVHWGGLPCDMEILQGVALHNNIPIIEDAAHAFGSSYADAPIGACNYSNYGIFSFQAIKHLNTGDGGALFMKDSESVARAKLLRWYGIDRESKRLDMRCLHPRTKLIIPGKPGQRMSIKSLYNQHYRGEIGVVDLSSNEIITGKIKNIFKNKRNGRKFYKIKNKKVSQKNQETIVTGDHLILTKSGFVKAENLKNGDRIISPFPYPSRIQKEIILGSILGDASIVSKTKDQNGKTLLGILQEGHTKLQEEYAILKHDSLFGLGVGYQERPPEPWRKNPNGGCSYYTRLNPYIGSLRNLFYSKNKKKKIAKKIISKYFSKLMLAILFMDDGYLRSWETLSGKKYNGEISTCGFSDNDNIWFSKLLTEFGYESVVFKTGEGYNKIGFHQESILKLMNDISPYIPNSMRENKFKNFKFSQPFNEDLWGDGSSTVGINQIQIDDYEDDTEDVYCIEVENNMKNFLTTSCVVHNCEADIEEAGFKFHMNDIAATIGISNLQIVDQNLSIARDNAAYYKEQLEGVSGIRLLSSGSVNPVISSYWLFTLLADDLPGFSRKMGERNIAVSQVHARNDKHSCVKDFECHLPNLESVIHRHISIPVGWWVTKEDREYIVQTIREGW
jgi:dTDP-4-amino-4,6-dideoxygalactose transaminase